MAVDVQALVQDARDVDDGQSFPDLPATAAATVGAQEDQTDCIVLLVDDGGRLGPSNLLVRGSRPGLLALKPMTALEVAWRP